MRNVEFSIFFLFLAILGATAKSTDWWMDIAFFAIMYGFFWWLTNKYAPPFRTVLLLLALPIPHLLGAWGLYSWSIGGVSWDVFVHIVTSFAGMLLLHSFFTGRQNTAKRIETLVLVFILILLLAGGVVELVEWFGGRSHREGDGLFLRGAGDFCATKTPCSSQEDTAKDAIDNIVGVVLGCVAIAYLYVHARDAKPTN